MPFVGVVFFLAAIGASYLASKRKDGGWWWVHLRPAVAFLLVFPVLAFPATSIAGGEPMVAFAAALLAAPAAVILPKLCLPPDPTSSPPPKPYEPTSTQTTWVPADPIEAFIERVKAAARPKWTRKALKEAKAPKLGFSRLPLGLTTEEWTRIGIMGFAIAVPFLLGVWMLWAGPGEHKRAGGVDAFQSDQAVPGERQKRVKRRKPTSGWGSSFDSQE